MLLTRRKLNVPDFQGREELMSWLSRYRDAVSLVVAMLVFTGILWWLIAVTAGIKG
jgi:hypothetical protein